MNVGAVEVADVATGGRPVDALTAAARRWARGPCMWDIAVRHDDGCPCLRGRPMAECTCEVVRLEGRRLA